MELSSLSLATAINSRGIYVIKAPTDGQKVSLTLQAQLQEAVTGCCCRGVSASPNRPLTVPCSTDFPRHSSSFNPSRGPGRPQGEARLLFRRAKELLNKLMLISGTKEHSNAEVVEVKECSNAEVVEVFSEVRIYIYVGASVLIPSVWAEHSHC